MRHSIWQIPAALSILAAAPAFATAPTITSFSPTLSPNLIRRAPSPTQLKPDLSLVAVQTPDLAR